MTKAYNMREAIELEFSLPPREAVIAAYAQYNLNDYNTWDYENKYGKEVEVGNWFFYCHDWSAKKQRSDDK